MIQSIVFVHGTGVRSWSYRVTADKVQAALRARGFKGHFEPCLWGDKHGAGLSHQGRSIPQFSGVQATTPDDRAWQALWSLLAADPLFELRELAGGSPAQTLLPPAAQQALQAFPALLRSLSSDAVVLAKSRGLLGAALLAEALNAVADSDALALATKASPGVNTGLRQAAARAVVAQAQRLRADPARQQGGDGDSAPLPQAQRDELVNALVDALGGVEMGAVADWVKKRLIGLGARWATDLAQRHRDVLYNGAYPAAGDILLYQKDGSAIRDEIAQHVAACAGPVAIIAHSLGGIACVDLLVERALPAVQLLVTVGSQAPLLYEMGALRQLTLNQPLPAHFVPHWLNVFDPDDLLSYQAAPVFAPPVPGGTVRDLQVQSGQPFPMSHSAYWESDLLWNTVAPLL
ncbi:hypothetical protein BurJ1DRAFT_4886 [Burkholderiales bacterium JOSHI_001]|nr:hypothetical protein BurJ1DRAFT_4886 [Burkholderiales bacterium JOSHI_001]